MRALRLSPQPLFSLIVVLGLPPTLWAQPSPIPDHRAKPEAATAALNKLPLRFEPTNRKGVFLARGMGAGVRLTATSIDFPLGSAAQTGDSIRLQFIGARKSNRVVGVDQLPGRVNYLLGADPSHWRTNVPTYARARTTSLYRGVDVEYYGADGLLEYDFVVHPGARPDKIRLDITGALVAISEIGDLVYGADRRVLLRKPVAYQVIEGDRRDVTVDYHRRRDGSFSFALGAYDRRRPLIIDPIVDYSFTFGGSGLDRALDLAVDNVGAVYIAGITYSSDFPTVNPADHRENAGNPTGCWEPLEPPTPCWDGFLAKLSENGAGLQYATYFSALDLVFNVAVDADHSVYFAGTASWLVNPGKWIVGKLAPDGSHFVYTVLTSPISGLALAPDGSLYMTTSEGVATLSPAGDNFHIVFPVPTFVTGLKLASFGPIAIGAGSVFVSGMTQNPDLFPTTTGAAQRQSAGWYEGVVIRLTMDGTVVYSTLVGGPDNDYPLDLTVDSEGAAYVVGYAQSGEHIWDPSPPYGLAAKVTPDGSAFSYVKFFSIVPPESHSWRVPERVSVNARGEAHTATCSYVFGPYQPDQLACLFWKVDETGALTSVPGVPSTLFAMDQAGAVYFGPPSLISLTGTNPPDINVTKFTFGVTSMSLTASEPLPTRFGVPIAWTAQTVADYPVEYSFIRYSPAGGWIEAQPFGSSRTFTWTPKSWDVGNNIVCVSARVVGSSSAPTSRCVDVTITGVSANDPPVLAAAADFDADRRPDLIWMNDATRQLAAWNMGAGSYGEQLVTASYLNSAPLPADWRLAGAGDIDGDGQTDLVLQSDTGQLGAWLFNGSTLRGGVLLTPGQLVDPNWQIRAVGDLNHDGHPDLIWQYAPTGQIAFWLMDGTTAIGYVIPSVAAPGADWEIIGTGDSNRDGERDIFWQQRSTGALAVWLMMNGTELAGGSVLSANPGAEWRAVAVTDLDGDAYSDVVLQNTNTGEVGAWYLQGTTVKFGALLQPSSVGAPGWSAVGPR